MAVRKTGLGKGLDSLIPMTKKEKTAERKNVNIKEAKSAETTLKITEIEPNREQGLISLCRVHKKLWIDTANHCTEKRRVL